MQQTVLAGASMHGIADGLARFPYIGRTVFDLIVNLFVLLSSVI